MAILIFENNVILANAIEQNLVAEEYDVLLIKEPNEVPEDEKYWQGIDLIILDLMMGDSELPNDWRKNTGNGLVTGYVVYEKMVPNKDIPVLVLTGLKDRAKNEEVKSSIKKCILLEKPIGYDKLIAAVRKLLPE